RCQNAGARLVVQKLPEMFDGEQEVVESFFAGATERTKLIVVSHVTSPTALILPIEAICRRAQELGIRICVDGPHALATVPVDINRLNCDFYCASCHKWLSAPFGSGFLYVHPRWKQTVRPVVLSWGESISGLPRSWHDEFVWSGTRDPSPFLAVPAAIDFLASLSAGTEPGTAESTVASVESSPCGSSSEGAWLRDASQGRDGVAVFRTRSSALARYARSKIAPLLQSEPLGKEGSGWYGPMISFPLPNRFGEVPPGHIHPLQAALWERHKIETLVANRNGQRHLRVSCHLYNDESDIDRLAAALAEILGDGKTAAAISSSC
ncbi:MAG TPA: aminotransferase class V-fold PLP-dependent enzyme, partial [Planctomycetaceae bacterium]|nr:aminotransferase class V-fold PLP-dependent enzyme [Planctomycetaceae bacterium]